MKRYVKDSDYYNDIVVGLKERYYSSLGHIFVDEMLVVIDTEFEIKPPKAKKNEEEPSEEAIDKWKDKKKKAWKFQMKKIPKIYQDIMEPKKEFMLIVRKSLVDELTEAQVVAYIYSEMRKITHEYKLQQPDVHTFSDLAEMLGRTDWDEAHDIPNILES